MYTSIIYFTIFYFLSVFQVDPFGPPALALPLTNGTTQKPINDQPASPEKWKWTLLAFVVILSLVILTSERLGNSIVQWEDSL